MMSAVSNWYDWLFYLYEQDLRCSDPCARGGDRPSGSGGTSHNVKSSFPGWSELARSLQQCQEAATGTATASTAATHEAHGRERVSVYGRGAKMEDTPEFYKRLRELGPHIKSCVTTRLIINVFPEYRTSHQGQAHPEDGHGHSHGHSQQRWEAPPDEDDPDDLSDWVKAEYLYRWPDGMERFCLDGALQDIIPVYDADTSTPTPTPTPTHGSQGQGQQLQLKLVEDFLGSLLYIIRNAHNTLYCNGYEIAQPRNPSLRFEIILFHLRPFRIVLRVAELDELDIVRLTDRIEFTATDPKRKSEQRVKEVKGEGSDSDVDGQGQEEVTDTETEDSDADLQSQSRQKSNGAKKKKLLKLKRRFCIYCPDPDYPQSAIKIEVPKDGTVVIDFPVFVKGLDIWESDLFDD